MKGKIYTAALLMSVLLSGCNVNDNPSTSPTVDSTVTENSTIPSAEIANTLVILEGIPVKGRAPKTGYDRELFGAAWTDVDHNGCDTRNDILARDMTNLTFKEGTHDCVVLTGVLADKYSGEIINFQRGQDTSTLVQIDHIISLSNAWQTGAQQLDEVTRTAFANDPLNLSASDGSLNMQKSDGDTATWLPPNKAFRCEYVTSQVAVKAKYNLWVTQPEKDAMVSVLGSCKDAAPSTVEPAAPLPATDVPIEPVPAPEPLPVETTEVPDASLAGDPQFDSCAKAKDAGFGPYLKDVDPEYGWYNDGDADGIACE